MNECPICWRQSLDSHWIQHALTFYNQSKSRILFRIDAKSSVNSAIHCDTFLLSPNRDPKCINCIDLKNFIFVQERERR